MTWEDLDEIRKSKGLSRKATSRLAGYGENAMGNAINGYSRASNKLWRALCELLGVDAPQPKEAPPRKVSAAPAPKPVTEPPRYVAPTFVKGKRYEISEQSHRPDIARPVTGTYLRKEGKHHVFKGPGGWLTTWTNAQLVGKRIEEVSPAATRDTKKKPKR